MDPYEGFKSNVGLLHQNLLDKGQLSDEQKSTLADRCSNLHNLTAQQCAELQRDLASWTPCWNILLGNNQDFRDNQTKVDWREGRFYEVLKQLT